MVHLILTLTSIISVPCAAVVSYSYMIASLAVIAALGNRRQTKFAPGFDTNLVYYYARQPVSRSEWI